MGWDSTREVPWRRLAKEWIIYSVVAALAFALIVREKNWSSYVALPIGATLYVGISAVLAKFGYQRKTLSQLRAETATRQAAKRQTATASSPRAVRSKPAPTSRTNAANRKRR